MAPALSPHAIHILKSTAPVVKTEGTKITGRMYDIMFEKYPVVNNLFNTTHVRKTGDTNSVPPQVGKWIMYLLKWTMHGLFLIIFGRYLQAVKNCSSITCRDWIQTRDLLFIYLLPWVGNIFITKAPALFGDSITL